MGGQSGVPLPSSHCIVISAWVFRILCQYWSSSKTQWWPPRWTTWWRRGGSSPSPTATSPWTGASSWLLYFLFAAQDGDTGGSGYGYGYETQDYGYGDSYAHSRQVRSQGASFSDVSNMMTNLLSSGSSPVASHAKEGLQALANSWSNTA